MVPQRPSAAPRAQPDRELCFRPRQLHPVGQAAAGAVRKAGVHGGRQHSPCPEPAGGGHLPDQLRTAFPAGGRGVCPHQKREVQQLPLFACAEPAGLGAGRKIPCTGGLLPRPAGAAGKVSAAFQHRPPRAGCLYFFSLEQPLVGWQLPAQWGDGAAWQALCVFYNPPRSARSCRCRLGAGRC